MADRSRKGNPFPGGVRWAALVWLVAWFAIYWYAWGLENFLHICNIAIILTCAGLWFSNSLLISSQAIASILADMLWTLDVAWRFFSGHHLFGGTAYMFNPRYALWVRLLSLYHLVWPILLLLALKKVGYDRRGWIYQSALAAIVIVVSRFADPTQNYNFAFRDPLFHRQWGPVPIHLAVIWLGFVLLTYLPTHAVLRKLFAGPRPSET